VRDKIGHFQLSFNGSLKADFQGSWVPPTAASFWFGIWTSDRDSVNSLDSKLTDWRILSLPMADLLSQVVYSRLAGYEDMNDAERLSQDPTLRLIGGDRTAAANGQMGKEIVCVPSS